ncbi:hypothetical protein E3N88_26140 [Mikania micrantha]|uniref:Uncharacterized protein n=1 Tax=Mikania micrantha TaxID=192012 RepID=A0A5N6N9G6_9ASTR|nr:hypothetical protein E3N88_26140 [Mikania micrantha]
MMTWFEGVACGVARRLRSEEAEFYEDEDEHEESEKDPVHEIVDEVAPVSPNTSPSKFSKPNKPSSFITPSSKVRVDVLQHKGLLGTWVRGTQQTPPSKVRVAQGSSNQKGSADLGFPAPGSSLALPRTSCSHHHHHGTPATSLLLEFTHVLQ